MDSMRLRKKTHVRDGLDTPVVDQYFRIVPTHKWRQSSLKNKDCQYCALRFREKSKHTECESSEAHDIASFLTTVCRGEYTPTERANLIGNTVLVGKFESAVIAQAVYLAQIINANVELQKRRVAEQRLETLLSYTIVETNT